MAFKRLGLILFVVLADYASLPGQSLRSGSNTLSITVGAEASLSVGSSTTALAESASASLTGTTNLHYKISNGSGTGAITVQLTKDAVVAGTRPSSSSSAASAANPLSKACRVVASGVSCHGTQTTAEEHSTPVTSFGADQASGPEGHSASLDWILANDKTSEAGAYRATPTFTISAT